MIDNYYHSRLVIESWLFHLLMNLSDALDKYFKSVSYEIRLLIKNKTEEIINMSANGKSWNEKLPEKSYGINFDK